MTTRVVTMTMASVLVVFVQMLMFTVTISSGQASPIAFDADKVTRMLQRSVDCYKTPGMAVAVVKDGQILYQKGFGFTDLDKKTPVTENTLFGIASISKSFAAALLVKLLNEKTNLTLDSKVSELLGDDFVMPDSFRTKETTFLDLLSHKTALLSNNRIRYGTDFNRDTLLSRLRLLPSDKQFRVNYIYNNLVYGLVGKLAEILDGTGTRWEELVSQHFLGALGMSKSTFLTRQDYTLDNYARGYMLRDGPDSPEQVTPTLSKKWAEVCASGAVMSTAHEMTEWINFHLQLGKNNKNQQVMDSTLVEQLHKPRFVITPLKYLDIQQPTFPITAHTTNYALGLRIGHYRSHRFIFHTGSTYGYSALMSMLPDEKIGVIVLMNNSDRQFRQRAATSHFLLDSALGVEPYINDKSMCSYPAPWISKDASSISYRPQRSDVPLKFTTTEYEGKYTNEAFGNMNIDFNSTLNSPVMTYGWGKWELLVWPKSGTKEQRLYGKAMAPVFPADMSPVHFISHPDNEKVIVGLRGNGFEKKRPPIFCKEDQTDVCTAIVQMTYPEQEEEMTSQKCPGSGASATYRSQSWQIGVLLPLIVFIFSSLKVEY